MALVDRIYTCPAQPSHCGTYHSHYTLPSQVTLSPLTPAQHRRAEPLPPSPSSPLHLPSSAIALRNMPLGVAALRQMASQCFTRGWGGT